MARALPKVLDHFHAHLPDGDLWVFGYGSLMWNPGFEFAHTIEATVHGWHRSLCLYSTGYRGTPEFPGLVLGLDRGGSCHGMAFRVPHAMKTHALLALWQREMRNRSYFPRLLRVRTGAVTVDALAFVVDPAHPHYAGKLPDSAIVERVARAGGSRGPNLEYLRNTLVHLQSVGVEDQRLARIARAVERFSPP